MEISTTSLHLYLTRRWTRKRWKEKATVKKRRKMMKTMKRFASEIFVTLLILCNTNTNYT